MSLLGLGNTASANRDDTKKVINSLTDSMRESLGDASAMYTRVADNSQKKVVQLVNDRRTLRDLKRQVETRQDDIKEAAELIEEIQRGDMFGKLLEMVNQSVRIIEQDKQKKKSAS